MATIEPHVFPTSLTEAEHFFVQFDIFKLEHVLPQSGINLIEYAKDKTIADIGRVLAQVQSAFDYSSKADEILTSISLPVQESPSEGSSLEYTDESTRDLQRMANILPGGPKAAGGGMIQSLIQDQLPEVAGKMVNKLQGQAKNQMQQTFFVAPSKREYSFNFDLIARNIRDSKELERIINRFQYHSNPGLPGGATGSYFTYPEMIRFFFQERDVSSGKLVNTKVFSSKSTSTTSQTNYYESKGCFITAFSADYGQDGYMKFSDPTTGESGLATAKLTLNLKEAEYFTKEDFA